MISDPVPNLKDQFALLSERCPVLCPSIFIKQFVPSDIASLCSNEAQVKKIRKFLSNESSDSSKNQVVFPTRIDFDAQHINITDIKLVDELDQSLYSVEKILTMMINGQPDSLNMLVQRFIEVNQHNVSLIEGKRLMYEAYHLAYSIKVAVSNLSEFSTVFRGISVPFPNDVNFDEVIKLKENNSSVTGSLKSSKKTKKDVSNTVVESSNIKGNGKRKLAASTIAESSAQVEDVDVIGADEEKPQSSDEEDNNNDSNPSSKKIKKRRGRGQGGKKK